MNSASASHSFIGGGDDDNYHHGIDNTHDDDDDISIEDYLSGISVVSNHQNHIHGNNNYNSISHRVNNSNYYNSNSLTNDNTYSNTRHNDDNDREYHNNAHHHVHEDDDEHQDQLFQDNMHNYPSYSIVEATIEDAMNNVDDELFFGDLDDTDNIER